MVSGEVSCEWMTIMHGQVVITSAAGKSAVSGSVSESSVDVFASYMHGMVCVMWCE